MINNSGKIWKRILLIPTSNVFLGFALDKESKFEDAETAYDAATRIRSSESQAWQGLIQLYEKQGAKKIIQYQNAAMKLAEIYQNLDDKYKCQDVIDKFLGFVKNEGTRLQHKQAQEIILPTSPLYYYLEGRVPHPSHTYQIMAQITEFEERERMNKEIGERRTRLGAKIGLVTIEVQREIFRSSQLECLYSNIIDWSNDDEVRRLYEEKLLQRCFEALNVLPAGNEKLEKLAKVLKLASEMVIIKHPYRLAWDITIEWKDAECIQDLDIGILRDYCTFFPTSGLGQVLRGFLTSEISPFPTLSPPVQEPQTSNGSDESEDDEDDGGGVALDLSVTSEDRLLLMVEGMSGASKSILAHRLMGEYYQFLDEHESVVELMRNGRRLVVEEATKSGISFDHSSVAIISLLATALVFYMSPKNHPEAKDLFDDLLSKNPKSTPALIGVGLIYEEEEDFPAAINYLQRALERDTANVRIKAEAAWVEALNGDYSHGRDELEACLPKIQVKDLRSRELLAQTQYRIGMCIWNLDNSKSARKTRGGAYSYFLASLKINLNFAPAYTSLGIYYADYAQDSQRARKCFQKAFELSAAEVEAAERLAGIFAQQKQWELVEVVAQRVVDSGKVRPAPGSKKKGVSWPFAALGVAELNKQIFAKSIVSFQSALRIAPDDYHSWVGLGESYHNSGRYIAATKAFQHAEKFDHLVEQQKSGEKWFAKYMLANVKRELGAYDEAIEAYKAVLESRPGEFAVSIALIQSLVESAWNGIDKGLFGYVSQRASEAIGEALKLAESRADAFNLWKAVGDACSAFSSVQGRLFPFPHDTVARLLQIGIEIDPYSILTDVDGVGLDVVFAKGLYSKNEQDGLNLTRCLHASILSHKRAIHASAHDLHAQAVAFYNLGWSEHRAHVSLFSGQKKPSTRYLKAAVRCFKRAIELEAGNAEFWNALGVMTSEINPQVAQHSFVRSLFLNERSSQTWTNLGSLYLLQNDLQLANDAFTRAQSSDPDFAHAWVGQGLIALMTHNRAEANLLFTHAMELSECSSIITKQQYSQSMFDRILSSKSVSSIVEIVQPLFALNQLFSMIPNKLTYNHLSALFLERIDDVSSAVEVLTNICATLEADYEVTESPALLSRFALGKADLARCQLAAGLYDGAIESGETALQLTDEEAGNELSAEARQKCRLSANLTVGLAHYYNDNIATALEYFQPAIEESNGDIDAICLLSQVLWAHGASDSFSHARDRLFDSLETYPEHVDFILLLGVTALLGKDMGSLEAVTASLQGLRARRTLTDKEQGRLGEVLCAIASSSQGDSGAAVRREVQTEVILHPDQPYGWRRLAEFDDDDYAAEMALKTAIMAAPPCGQLDALDLSMAFAGTGKIGDSQKAAMIAPWSRRAWEALEDVLS